MGASEAGRVHAAWSERLDAWVGTRPFGLLSFAFVVAGQFAVLLAYVFNPDKPFQPRSLESPWTDDLPSLWLGCSGFAILLAIIGLIADARRATAGAALFAAFFGFLWPWGS